MEKDTFFITTPIYYTNGVPHVWHAYSSLIADTFAKYHKISGKKVKFSTWVDENSQKALLKAQEEWKEVQEYLDIMAQKHKDVWDGLKIGYTDFIRTTQPRHHEFVRKVLQKCYDNWDIYQADYEGLYCIWCEAFKKEDDLIEKNGQKVCPDHLTVPQTLKEKNWFFRLSKYENFLKKHYKEHPHFVLPNNRFNEVKAFVERWLEDFSISRENNTFWIRLPFDESQVTYVWFDALFNYITVCEYPDAGGNQSEFWPADVHVIGKDIVKFHAIYWPAMLESSWYALPKHLLTTGYFTIDGQKISKTLGNVIDPVEFSHTYSKDLLMLYLFLSINVGYDGDFDKKQALLMYNAKLANNLWNLVNRVVVLALKMSGILNRPEEFSWNMYAEISDGIYEWHPMVSLQYFQEDFYHAMEKFDIKTALDSVFFYVSNLNKFADEKEPWNMLKQPDKNQDTQEVLYILSEWLRQVWLALYPFFSEKMSEMFTKLWLKNYEQELLLGKLKDLQERNETFVITEKWNALYARFEVE